MPNENDEVIVDDVVETNETADETAEEIVEEKPKTEKPKRTPQEEYEYHQGRANRLAKKLGLKDEKPEIVKETPSGKPSELDFGQKAYLKSYGISGSDELALVKQFQDRGFGLDNIVEDDVFVAKLNSLREARETANAVPKGQRRSGQTAVTDVDLAYAKFKETGELPQDFDTRNKIIDRLSAEEKAPYTRM